MALYQTPEESQSSYSILKLTAISLHGWKYMSNRVIQEILDIVQ